MGANQLLHTFSVLQIGCFMFPYYIKSAVIKCVSALKLSVLKETFIKDCKLLGMLCTNALQPMIKT